MMSCIAKQEDRYNCENAASIQSRRLRGQLNACGTHSLYRYHVSISLRSLELCRPYMIF